MANFQISLVDPNTGQPDITVANDILAIQDHSNYDESVPEAGHARADFKDFYKLIIGLPNGDEHRFSSLGDGDEIIDTPDAGDPQVDYSYPSGDGIYWVYVYSVPTYNPAASYDIATNPYIYYGGKLWRVLINSTGVTPVEGANYTEVTLNQLSSKYRIAQRLVIYNDGKRTWARRLYNANAVNNRVGDNWEKLLADPEFRDSVRLFISITSIPVLMAADDWAGVDKNINQLKQISSKYEV